MGALKWCWRHARDGCRQAWPKYAPAPGHISAMRRIWLGGRQTVSGWLVPPSVPMQGACLGALAGGHRAVRQLRGKVRMMADGSAEFAKATGLTLDLTARGMGLRSNRYSMLVVDGVVKTLNIEGPGKFEVSDADTMLGQAKNVLA